MKIKNILKQSIPKKYLLLAILVTMLVITSCASYAMFTVTEEKNNAISIVTGSLYYQLTVDGSNTTSINVPANTTKTYTVVLTNNNNRTARFNFYYIGNLASNVEIGYVVEAEAIAPPAATGVNLESNSSQTYQVKVSNNSSSAVTIQLGVSVGLDYNDLSLPSNGHLLEEAQLSAAETLLAKANPEDLDYNSASSEQQKEMWTFSHPATEQTEALTDYRYIGVDPNNYVSFNDELWRIIGVFTVDDGTGKKEQRLKIIRDKSIGSYSYDNKTSGIGSSTSSYGSNEWQDARLNYLLNPGHENESVGGSLYWNSGSGNCYSGSNNGTKECDFTTTGLKEEARNMIGDTLWYLGGSSTDNDVTATMFYERERGTNVYSGRSTSWIGKVGLMYPSDYGYATSGGATTNRNACLNKELYNWNSSSFSDCKNNDWLYDSSTYQWTLTSRSSNSTIVFLVRHTGSVYSYIAYNAIGARPVVFLKSNITIASGNGSSSQPYVMETKFSVCDINEDGTTDEGDLMEMETAVRSGNTDGLPESCDFNDDGLFDYNDYSLLEDYLISIGK